MVHNGMQDCRDYSETMRKEHKEEASGWLESRIQCRIKKKKQTVEGWGLQDWPCSIVGTAAACNTGIPHEHQFVPWLFHSLAIQLPANTFWEAVLDGSHVWDPRNPVRDLDGPLGPRVLWDSISEPENRSLLLDLCSFVFQVYENKLERERKRVFSGLDLWCSRWQLSLTTPASHTGVTSSCPSTSLLMT